MMNTHKQTYDNRNLTLLVDFYELTMGNAYFEQGMRDQIAVYDMFFRNVPDDGGFAILAGLEQVVEYLANLHFTEADLTYLNGRELFSPEFIDYLRNFKFECDVWAIPEGTPIFPGEPIVRVRGPIIQAQLIETMVLLTINHQSLIATKTNRICRAAQGRAILEFGTRRAQGFDAANYGARAAYIGGASATANTWADSRFGVPANGTMAHAWVQSFDSEFEAFVAYAKTYPDHCNLLVDTFSTLKSGIPNAIKVAKEILEPMGKRLVGIRLDSGDIAYLSKKARRMLDEAGLQDCKIFASNSLDERIIRSLLIQDAKIDVFGVGEKLITAASSPVFGGVYKLVAMIEKDGTITPKIKLSDTFEKATTPGFKDVWRLYESGDHHPVADVLTLTDEIIEDNVPYEIFDPIEPSKRKTVSDFYAKKLLAPIFEKGELVYQLPDLETIRAESAQKIAELWDEVKRLENPHVYYVDLSQRLWDLKTGMLNEIRSRVQKIQ